MKQYIPAWLTQVDQWMARPCSARLAVAWLSVYFLVAANWTLWGALAHLGGPPSVYLRLVAAMAVLVGFGTLALLSLTAWSRWMKPVWFVLLLVAAVAQHYMLTYRVVMDPTMAANAMQTDLHETRDLLGPRMLLNVLLVMALPTWWLLRVRILPMRLWGQLWRNALLLVAALAVVAGGAAAMSRDLAPLMRNNTTLRYMMNPLAIVYSSGAVFIKPLFKRSGKLIPISGGAALGASYAAQIKPPLFVMVVGETARSDHFALNGYARDTTPQLAARDVLSWRNVHSCGTNTLASVPCMFSHLGKQGYEGRKDDYESLLDVAQAAGLAVLWIDNQAGCKGVCVRVPNVSAGDGLDPAVKSALCDGDECLDDVMLKNIDQRIAALPADRRSKGVLLVLHQMGSHGPAYYKRSNSNSKRFLPECKTNVLADCSHGELINAYDNSIAHTDQFLAHTIDWLKTQSPKFDTGMLYMSDHGESLGEFGLFLHGLPYDFAPEVQKHVPMVAWFDAGLLAREKLSTRCLQGNRDAALTHDNLYHTLLGVMDVRTPTYKPQLDAFAHCRGAAG
ncbi:lipid A ethanolaminephosphotransferase [Variovorax ginsengisoli]|uniref:Lipid A ethanolaminephosphotransferase n=1 Tax=Variovorax ginsengisoli TaxID=363844 RepID=A0ABT9S5J8_9BURK|nr:lipid A ethanolaminephosphotransferase [Variovorax ginsengisoli]